MFKHKVTKYILFFFLLFLIYSLQILIFAKFEINAYTNAIIESYILNSGLVILFFLFVDLFKKKLINQIGFAFLFSSLLKFVLFGVFIYPIYAANLDVSKQEFVTFFIPYVFCLIYEITIISKILNKMKIQ